MADKPPEDQLLTLRQTAERLNISPRTLHRYLDSNQISGFLLPGGWRFSPDEVNRFIESKRPEEGKGTRVKRKYTRKAKSE